MGSDFEVGDLVQLKSGGPVMTVQSSDTVGATGQICCQWFGGKKLEEGWFPPKSLKRAEEDGSGGRGKA